MRFESRIQYISRKKLMILISAIVVPIVLSARLLTLLIGSRVLVLFLFCTISILIFAIGYWRGFWSNKRLQLSTEGQEFRLTVMDRKKPAVTFKNLTLIGYGWSYEESTVPFSKTTNIILTVQFKSDESVLYLMESLSPWQPIPNEIPYFNQAIIKDGSCYFFVKGLRTLITDLKK